MVISSLLNDTGTLLNPDEFRVVNWRKYSEFEEKSVCESTPYLSSRVVVMIPLDGIGVLGLLFKKLLING